MPTTTRRGYGLLRDRHDPRDLLLHEHVRLAPVSALPPSVDLRTGGHLGFDIYDQGDLGSCTANAIAAGLRLQAGAQGLADLDPARLWIYYQERVIEGTVSEDAGAELRDGLKVVAQLGWPAEADWPYDVARFAEAPSAQSDTDASADLATKYMRVTTSTSSLKQALAAGLAVIVGFDVYASFESDPVAVSGTVPLPVPGEQLLGGHAVLCVGYDDGVKRFLCRNSWSEGWGAKGYFTMPYAYLGSPSYARDFWAIEVVREGAAPQPGPSPSPSPQPTPVPPEDVLQWLEAEAQRLPEPIRDWVEAYLAWAEQHQPRP